MKKFSTKNKIFIGLVLMLLATGCGLKANPVPSASALSQKQGEQKLTVSSDGNAVVLTWQYQNQDGKLSHMNIEKSELGSAGNICGDCPRIFEKIGQIPVNSEKSEYQYIDQSVERGKTYSYRLKYCDEADICRESRAAEIDLK